MAEDKFDKGRRDMLRFGAAGAAAAGAAGAGSLNGASAAIFGEGPVGDLLTELRRDEYDYIIIGSGPGGAPLAANLAEAGYSVLVLEAGKSKGNKTLYDVPAYFAEAADDPQVRWDFFIDNYTNDSLHGSLYVPEEGGVLYPRVGALGGCTYHHALFTLYPEEADWKFIEVLTGDNSWNPDAMWGHWESMKRWQYTAQPLPVTGANDLQYLKLLYSTINSQGLLPEGNRPVGPNPNSRTNVERSAQGFFLPVQMQLGANRFGPRERLLKAAGGNDNLEIQTDALAEKVILEPDADGNQRAVGVQFLKGEQLYKASPIAPELSESERNQSRRTVRARKEVIVAGGAINTPQLLMLSGIGPRTHLSQMGIETKVNSPGVGGNLQDRIEVVVQNEYPEAFNTVEECTFDPADDPCLTEWRTLGPQSRYASNGFPAFVKHRAPNGRPYPEMVLFGGPLNFKGYQPDWDDIAVQRPRNIWTWNILKAYPRADLKGLVRLRSKDPTDVPSVNKRSLNDGRGQAFDQEAIKYAVGLARQLSARVGGDYKEIRPGSDSNLDEYIIKEQYGHHISCSAPIGNDRNRFAVLDSKFRVRGTNGLRVVDASVFPRIPGLFIWAAIGIISEKASVDILRDA